MYVLGLDPGLAKFGYALMRFKDQHFRVIVKIGTWATEKESHKTSVRVADDNVRRARELAKNLRELFQIPHPPNLLTAPNVICAEAMSHPRAASAAGKLSMSWGVLAVYAEEYQVPICQASPQRIKKVLCGRQNASKKDVQQALENRFSGVFDGLRAWEREHAADALGAIIACEDSEVMRLVRRTAA